MVVARFMDNLKLKFGFGQQYMLEKGLKKFGDKGIESTKKEIGQLHDRKLFRPVHVKDITSNERRKAQIALAYLTEKRDDEIKGRVVYNGKPTREYLGREDSSSPRASLESILLTGMIDAHEG